MFQVKKTHLGSGLGGLDRQVRAGRGKSGHVGAGGLRPQAWICSFSSKFRRRGSRPRTAQDEQQQVQNAAQGTPLHSDVAKALQLPGGTVC